MIDPEGYRRPLYMLVLSAVLGLVGGVGAVFFLALLHAMQWLFMDRVAGIHVLDVAHAAALHAPPLVRRWNPWIPLATTLGGLLAGLLVYDFAPEAEGHGTDAAVRAYHRLKGFIRGRVILIKSLASAITIGSGGAAGREGPTAQIAAGIASWLGRRLRLDEAEVKLLVLVGMAAGLSAIFKSPLGTALFAVEVLYAGLSFDGRGLPYTLAGASVAYAVMGKLTGWSTLFTVPASVGFEQPWTLVLYAALGVLGGVFAAVLPSLFYGTRDAFRRLRLPALVKPALGGLALGLVGLALPQVLGGGYGEIQLAIQGTAGPVFMLLLGLALAKMLALSLTVGSGGSGGIFAPGLFVGAMLGAGFGALLQALGVPDVPLAGFALVGMATVFGSAARVPLATTVMVAEMTGGYALMAPTMLAVAIGYLLQVRLTRNARYSTLYEAQERLPGSPSVDLEP